MRRLSVLLLFLFVGLFLIGAGPKSKNPPSFNPEEGIFEEEICVEIINNFTDSTVYYTVDGSDPTAASDEYTGQICLDISTIIKAISIKGRKKSKIASAVYAINEATSPVPKTGQTTSYGDYDDGVFQTGIAWPDPRFTDNGNGTVTDNFTGLIWTKTVKCPWQAKSWNDALMAANSLHDGWDGDDFDGDCGLEDDSLAGDWRLPNARELLSLIDFGTHYPALPSGHPFIPEHTPGGGGGGPIPPDFFWSSTSSHDYPQVEAWAVNIGYGSMTIWDKAQGSCHVWPVRGPE